MAQDWTQIPSLLEAARHKMRGTQVYLVQAGRVYRGFVEEIQPKSHPLHPIHFQGRLLHPPGTDGTEEISVWVKPEALFIQSSKR